MMPNINKIYQGDSLEVMKTWPSDFVHCIITSPPYYGLRDYGVAGQIGMETTPSAYIYKMMRIFDEVKRILRPDGTLWLNMGDSYASNCNVGNKWEKRKKEDISKAYCTKAGGAGLEYYKEKDMMLIPFRLAMEMQKTGWYLRSVMPWIKRNSMPDSTKDRPGTVIEHVFLFSKSPKYYFDMEAVRRPHIEAHLRRYRSKFWGEGTKEAIGGRPGGDTNTSGMKQPNINGRAWRSSDTFFNSFQGLYMEDDNPLAFIVNPKPLKEAHFASFPELLVRDCILAGTSEKGSCKNCGNFYFRDISPSPEYEKLLGKGYHDHSRDITEGMMQSKSLHHFYGEKYVTKRWKKSCKCGIAETVPCLVFDPFMGSGTTALVSKKLFRNFLGIELNSDYISIADKRLMEVALI